MPQVGEEEQWQSYLEKVLRRRNNKHNGEYAFKIILSITETFKNKIALLFFSYERIHDTIKIIGVEEDGI